MRAVGIEARYTIVMYNIRQVYCARDDINEKGLYVTGVYDRTTRRLI